MDNGRPSGGIMQVGDLVELSSAGRKSQQNMAVQDCIGLLVEICKGEAYPYKVQWYGVDVSYVTINETRILPCKRYELKRIKATK